ncbi:MAG TPA: sulfotransferase [Acidimicrobiia bacterium]|nr:sulfotransferase [Acidimicrobiia bacterium]
MSGGPVFVTGAGRSGKTLLRWLLSSHPNLVVTRRAELWPRFAGRFGDLADDANFTRCLHEMLERRQVAWLGPDRQELRRAFVAGAPTDARLFDLVHRQHAARNQKARWGDQSAAYERCADELLGAFPDATVIHMMRDPRDRHVAVGDQRRARPGDVGRTTADWIRSAVRARHHADRWAESYVIVRYEDLVLRPDAIVRDLCRVIGEPYVPELLRMESTRRYDAYRAESPCPLSSEFVGLHRAQLPAHDLAFIQTVAGEEMAALGYEVEPVRLDRGARVRLAIHLPANAVRLGVSRSTSSVSDRETVA